MIKIWVIYPTVVKKSYPPRPGIQKRTTTYYQSLMEIVGEIEQKFSYLNPTIQKLFLELHNMAKGVNTKFSYDILLNVFGPIIREATKVFIHCNIPQGLSEVCETMRGRDLCWSYYDEISKKEFDKIPKMNVEPKCKLMSISHLMERKYGLLDYEIPFGTTKKPLEHNDLPISPHIRNFDIYCEDRKE